MLQRKVSAAARAYAAPAPARADCTRPPIIARRSACSSPAKDRRSLRSQICCRRRLCSRSRMPSSWSLWACPHVRARL